MTYLFLKQLLWYTLIPDVLVPMVALSCFSFHVFF